MKRFLLRSFIFAACAFVAGCAVQNPAWDTFLYVFPSYRQYAQVQPGVEYLVVELDGRAAVMALGSRRVQGQAPHTVVTERWYNANGEMLMLQNGRIQEVMGMSQEWRNQESKPPTWQAVSEADFREEWTRKLDVMPGYRYGQIDRIITGKIAALRGVSNDVPANAQWFADMVESQTRTGQPWQFMQKFAVVDGKVVYSEQCVSESICLKIRPMGVVIKK